jgi:TM2 domain-containing membrane protein YozV
VLKDPALAALLAWLVPGLGHIYQGRTAKGILFFVCLMTTFAYGCYLGGSPTVGWGRVVYVAWRDDDTRLAYLCQVGIGLPALPAIVQASLAKKGKEPRWNGFMAPPQPEGLRSYFDLGTAYTMIAGLLNILAVYDAWGGPVFMEPAKKEDEDEEEKNERNPESSSDL